MLQAAASLLPRRISTNSCCGSIGFRASGAGAHPQGEIGDCHYPHPAGRGSPGRSAACRDRGRRTCGFRRAFEEVRWFRTPAQRVGGHGQRRGSPALRRRFRRSCSRRRSSLRRRLGRSGGPVTCQAALAGCPPPPNSPRTASAGASRTFRQRTAGGIRPARRASGTTSYCQSGRRSSAAAFRLQHGFRACWLEGWPGGRDGKQ